MSGLISVPAAPNDPENAQVVADGWFPPITLASVRDRLRLGDGSITTARLVEAIEDGMLHAFRELATWRAARVLAGAAELAAVTDQTLNDENLAVVLWNRIVRCLAGAALAADYREVTATTSALDRAAEKDETSEELRRRALAAVADLLSIGGDPVPRTRVELV